MRAGASVQHNCTVVKIKAYRDSPLISCTTSLSSANFTGFKWGYSVLYYIILYLLLLRK